MAQQSPKSQKHLLSELEGTTTIHHLHIENSTLTEITTPEASKHLPRYLYRVHTKDAQGSNTPMLFKSRAVPNSHSYPHLSSIPFATAKTMLQNHLEWRIFNSDSFISFTSLLRIALQNAINKAASGFGVKEIYICVVDTRKINHDALYLAPTLCEIYDLPNADKTQHRYFTNEYLAYGVLDVSGASCTVSFGTLIENGFGEFAPEVQTLMPEMRVGGGRQVVQGPICQLRFFFDNTTTARVVTEAEVNLALLLAFKFGEEWASMLTVVLLNVRKRVSWDPELLKLARDFADVLRNAPSPFPLYDTYQSRHWVDEMSSLGYLMKEVYEEV